MTNHIWRVTIRRNKDKLERTCLMQAGPWDENVGRYWFTEGWMACDCNRRTDFEQAGNDEAITPPCSHGAYTITKITQDDNPAILYSELV